MKCHGGSASTNKSPPQITPTFVDTFLAQLTLSYGLYTLGTRLRTCNRRELRRSPVWQRKEMQDEALPGAVWQVSNKERRIRGARITRGHLRRRDRSDLQITTVELANTRNKKRTPAT
ncbi:unnamed protein product [Ixodes pacificus]